MVADADNDDPSTVQSSAESTESLEGIPKHWELGSIVPALWQPTYEQLFSSELERNRALATRLGVFVGQPQQLSAYARRLQGERREAWQRKQLVRERDQLAIALHSYNMRLWSPSLVARSIAYFTLTTSGCASKYWANFSALAECLSILKNSVSKLFESTQALKGDIAGPVLRQKV